jgi:hypothetical protein
MLLAAAAMAMTAVDLVTDAAAVDRVAAEFGGSGVRASAAAARRLAGAG